MKMDRTDERKKEGRKRKIESGKERVRNERICEEKKYREEYEFEEEDRVQRQTFLNEYQRKLERKRKRGAEGCGDGAGHGGA